jgi:small neutral amino acid transporter SnatA (MarC family)
MCATIPLVEYSKQEEQWLLGEKYQGLKTETFLEKMVTVSSIFVVSLVIFFIFFLAPKILKYLGQAGIRSMSKIMGFIVLSLGIQMVVDSLNILLKL